MRARNKAGEPREYLRCTSDLSPINDIEEKTVLTAE
jgi:hypothetical protein